MVLAFFVGVWGTKVTHRGARQGMGGGARASWGVLIAGLSLAGLPPVHAAGLGKQACYELRVELGFLRATGAEEDMKQGPDWAKVNLTREELKHVQRLVEVEEQLRFRCGKLRGRLAAKKPKVIPPPDTPMKKPASPKSAAQRMPPAAKKATALSPQKRAAKSKARKKVSAPPKRRRAKKADALAPNQAVTNALSPYGGFR